MTPPLSEGPSDVPAADTRPVRAGDAEAAAPDDPTASPRTFARLPVNLQASVLLLAALVAFAAMTVLIKVAGATIPLVEILTVRQLVMQGVTFLIARKGLRTLLRTDVPGLQILRGVLQLGAMVFSFLAVVHLPLALAMAISFAHAIFVTAGAGFLLRERVGGGRWIATAAGVVGVVLMLQPSGEVELHYLLAAVLGAVLSAASALTLRLGPPRQAAETILTYQAIVLVGALIGPTVLVWVTPDVFEWVLLIAIGLTGTAGQWLLTIAFRRGEASALAPLDFVRLILTMGIGIVFFGDVLDVLAVGGALLLFFATGYTFWLNARRR